MLSRGQRELKEIESLSHWNTVPITFFNKIVSTLDSHFMTLKHYLVLSVMHLQTLNFIVKLKCLTHECPSHLIQLIKQSRLEDLKEQN